MAKKLDQISLLGNLREKITQASQCVSCVNARPKQRQFFLFFFVFCSNTERTAANINSDTCNTRSHSLSHVVTRYHTLTLPVTCCHTLSHAHTPCHMLSHAITRSHSFPWKMGNCTCSFFFVSGYLRQSFLLRI